MSTPVPPPTQIAGEQPHQMTADEEKLAAAQAAAATKIFSTSKPRDAMEGFSKGGGNFMKGLVGGAALVVGAPIAMAREGKKEGGAWGAAKGFGKGLGLGLVGGTALAVGGMVTGAVQLGRGIYHTPGSYSMYLFRLYLCSFMLCGYMLLTHVTIPCICLFYISIPSHSFDPHTNVITYYRCHECSISRKGMGLRKKRMDHLQSQRGGRSHSANDTRRIFRKSHLWW